MTTLSFLKAPPEELIQQLQHHTHMALTSNHIEDLGYFKFILLDNTLSALIVVNEFHMPMDWNSSGKLVCRRIQHALDGFDEESSITLSFAGREIGDTRTLSSSGASYGDKVYFNLDVINLATPIAERVSQWHTYFRDVGRVMERNPALYALIAETVCAKFAVTTQPEQLTTDDWNKILALRNLCGLYAERADSAFALSTTRLLTTTLTTVLEAQNVTGVYHLANILEWLAYLRPRMFEGFDLLEGQQARKALAAALLSCIDPAYNLPPLVRLEAAWAIGWISVASQDFGREVYERLIEYERDEPLLAVRVAIRSAALRSLLYPSPYYMAALSQAGGWFQASVLDQNEFRRVAISGHRDEALFNFHAQLSDVLPPQSRSSLL